MCTLCMHTFYELVYEYGVISKLCYCGNGFLLNDMLNE